MDSRREGEHEGSQVSQVPEPNDSRAVEARVSVQNLEADQQVAEANASAQVTSDGQTRVLPLSPGIGAASPVNVQLTTTGPNVTEGGSLQHASLPNLLGS